MELTRSGPLRTTLIGAASSADHDSAEEMTQGAAERPEGVIAPFAWGDGLIPSSGVGSAGTAVIDAAVTSVMREYGIVGCGVCVVRAESIEYAKGFGYAEPPDIPFTADTASRCGSLAKPVTALAALLLADEGELDLDEEVLPILEAAGIAPRPVGSARIDERIPSIRVRHLMDHTSGLPAGTTYTAWRADRNVAALHRLTHAATAVDVVCDGLGSARLDSEPGTQFQYANANFVILARVIEAKTGMPFSVYLTQEAMPKLGVKPDEVYVSRNQTSPRSASRGRNEAAYYQTSTERYVSYLPAEQPRGRVFGEAYRGYATEASDGGGGIACTAPGLGRILATLHSERPALSSNALSELRTPPAHCASDPGFDPATSPFYSKGFSVRYEDGRPWYSHGGMTNHCGGVIGHDAGYQWAVVSNWNHSQPPYVDRILDRALSEAVGKLG